MSEKKDFAVVFLMLLCSMAIYCAMAVYAKRWAGFSAVLACTVPMLVFRRVRGRTYGTSDTNVFKYSVREYKYFFVFCICGCAVISAVSTYVFKELGFLREAASGRSDFFYRLVFSCFIPAFFEEWFVRGGLLGLLSKYRGIGVVLCSLCFMLMHASPMSFAYVFFAGLCITSVVYLAESIYVGMALHFLNNLTSLFLSYLKDDFTSHIALTVLILLFFISAFVLRKTSLAGDIKKLFWSKS